MWSKQAVIHYEDGVARAQHAGAMESTEKALRLLREGDLEEAKFWLQIAANGIDGLTARLAETEG